MMATLDSLKHALREEAQAIASSAKLPLSDTQYSAAFELLTSGPGWSTYQDFIIPQLSKLIAPLFDSRTHISVLEIGPGPKSLFGYLPDRLKKKVKKYTAFEPNGTFAARLEDWLCYTSKTESRLPSLESSPDIHQIPFVLKDTIGNAGGIDTAGYDNKYDIILFCHSIYGMKPEDKFIEQALDMLVENPSGAMVVVFHRDKLLNLNGLICHQAVTFPTAVVRVSDNDKDLNCFTSFIAGFIMQDLNEQEAVQVKWRELCRNLGHCDEADPSHLLFSSPNIMIAFTRHATALPELEELVPMVEGPKKIKNREVDARRSAAIVKPTEVQHIQQCVRWALKHGVNLTVLGGGHSGQCLWPYTVSIDMSAFNRVQLLKTGEDEANSVSGSLIVVGAGCTTEDIIRKTMAAGVTVPLGARPSVGAGLWLQGGIGHLARLYGLASDAVVGAIVVSVDSGQVLCIGRVPSQHWPAGAVRPETELDYLWAIKGAGANFGIVVSVTFHAYTAPTFLTRQWVVPLRDRSEAQQRLSDFNELVAAELPRNYSADAYLYWDDGQLKLGVTMFEAFTTGLTSVPTTPPPTPLDAILGPGHDLKAVDGVGLFDTDMYISGLHGGHIGGKTSSFKRCIFLKGIRAAHVADRLTTAIETCPSALCYLHLLQGGGAIRDVAPDATAFGCRDWDFACVITAVWPRVQDGTKLAQSAVRWVYDVATSLLYLSSGAYAADLGPDPRDVVLAVKAFGPNRTRLASLKRILDPHNVLAYACPLLLKAPTKPKLVVLVTGENGAGKDHCADIWVSVLNNYIHKSLTARAVRISDSLKRDYAATSGADLSRLLLDRAYKERHRPALTVFYHEQKRQQPELPRKHFLDLVCDAADVDILLVTGLKDKAPVAALSHLVPDRRLVEVNVQASDQTRRTRRGFQSSDEKAYNDSQSKLPDLNYHPGFIFDNDGVGNEKAERFAEQQLLPLFHEDFQRLADMVRLVPTFPRQPINFRHVLGIAQQPGGLALCTSLMQTHFTGDWSKVDAVVSCETGGFVFASSLASKIDVPLVLVREAGKLPPPTLTVTVPASHITSLASAHVEEKQIEIEQDVVMKGASVVVVDDVLSTGETLCAVLQLLDQAGVRARNVSVMVIAEFPFHRGRDLLCRRGFGKANVQSLLVFGGV